MAYRIAILHDGFVPIYRVRFFELLNTLSEHDYVVFHGDPPWDSGHRAALGPFAFPDVRSRNRQLRIGGRTLIYEPVLRKVLSGDFDAVVVGHEFKFVSAMLLFGLFRVRRKSALLWGHGYHRPGANLLARLAAAPVARLADGYLAYTEGGAARLRAAGISAARITVVRNTIDMAEQRAARDRFAGVDRAVLRVELGLPPGGKSLLYIGRLSARKRINEAIELVRRLNAEHPDLGPVQLLVVGDGPEREALAAQAAGHLGIRFLGEVRDPVEVARLMRVTAAAVIPGAVGLAANHAFAHGLPLITRVDDNHGPEIEYVRDRENGLVVAGSFDSFCAEVAAFLRDPAAARRLTIGALRTSEALGLEHAARRFDEGVVGTIERRRDRGAVASPRSPDGAHCDSTRGGVSGD